MALLLVLAAAASGPCAAPGEACVAGDAKPSASDEAVMLQLWAKASENLKVKELAEDSPAALAELASQRFKKTSDRRRRICCLTTTPFTTTPGETRGTTAPPFGDGSSTSTTTITTTTI